MKSLRSAALFLATVALLAIPATQSFASVVPMDLKALTTAANSVVVVKVTANGSRAGKGSKGIERAGIVTDTKVHVTKVLKGNKPSEIVVTQPGGSLGSDKLVISDLPEFTPGERCILFLNADGGVVGGYQGKLAIDGSDVPSLGKSLKETLASIDSYADGVTPVRTFKPTSQTNVTFEAAASVVGAETVTASAAADSGVGVSALVPGTLYLNETFDTAPTGWSLVDYGGGFGVTGYRAQAGSGSLYSAQTAIPAPGPVPQEHYSEFTRIAPVNLTGCTRGDLEYDVYSNQTLDSGNWFTVALAKTPDGPWYTSDQFTLGNTGGWQHVDIDLRSVTDYWGTGTTAFTGGNVYIQLITQHMIGAADEGVYIDNLTVTGSSPVTPVITSMTPSGANAGVSETVTITGTGFGATQGTGSVKFLHGQYQDGTQVPATVYSSWSDTRIVCQVPRYAQSGGVVVTNNSVIPSVAYSYQVGFSAGGPKATTYPVSYWINENCGDAVVEGPEIQAAFPTWNDAGSAFNVNYAGPTLMSINPPAAANGLNEIYFAPSGFTDPNILAWNTYWYNNGVITDTNIVFNDFFNWTAGAGVGRYDVRSVALHEIGHTVGLDDQYLETSKVMGASSMNTTRRALSTSEINGARLLHGSDVAAPTAPVVTAPSHASQTTWYSNNDPYLQFSATDEGGVTGYSYSIDQTANTVPDNISEGLATNKSYTNIADGTWYFHVKATDGAGNWSVTSHYGLKIDTTAPTIACPQNGTFLAPPALVQLLADDRHSGVAGITYGLDEAPSTPYVGIFSVATLGTHVLNYTVSDAAGNVSTLQSSTFTVDGTAPVSSATAPSAWVHSPAVVSLSSTDTQVGVGRIVYSVDGSAEATYSAPISITAEGTHTIGFAGIDKLGNRETTKTVQVRVDDSAPVTGNDAPSGWQYGPVPVTLTSSDSLSGLGTILYSVDGSEPSLVCTGPVIVSAPGVTTIKYAALDVVGNRETTKSTTVQIDRTAPTATDDANTAWTQGPLTVHLTCDDTQSGVGTVRYSVDGSAPSLPYTGSIVVTAEGTSTIRYQAVDAVGNAGDVKSVDVHLDNTAPASADNAPTDWVGGTTLVTLSSDDALSGSYAIVYRLDGQAEVTYGSPVSVSGEGTHTLQYAGIDRVGNRETTRTATVRIDQTAPVSSNDAPTGWQRSNVAVHLTATDTQAGVQSTYYSLDGSEPSILATGTTVISTEGTTTLKYCSVDKVGNREAAKSVTVKLDKTAPVSTSDAPAGWVGGPVTVHLSATDGLSGAAATRYSVNGSAAATCTAAGFTVSAEGTNTIRYWGVDTAGNSETTRTAYAKIDYTAPVTGSSAKSSYVDSATISMTPVDALSGTSSTQWRIDGGAWTFGRTASSSVVGTHTLQWRSTDAVGNVETTKTAAFEILKRFEEADSRVYLSGSWATAQSVWRSGGTWTFTQTPGSAAYVSFTGTRVDLISTKASTMGIARITLDGGSASYADFYASASAHQVSVWSATGLSNSRHTLKIEYTGTKNDASGGTAIGIDAIDVNGALGPDVASPITSDDAPRTWRSDSATVTLAAADADTWVTATKYRLNEGAVATYTVPLSISAEGTTTIEYFSLDAAGNREATKTASIRIDRTAPYITDDSSPAWSSGPVSVHLNADDAGSGVASVLYSVDGSEPSLQYGDAITVSSEGTTTVKYVATDGVGWSSGVKSCTVRIDEGAPVTENDAPTGWSNGPVSVSLLSQDALSGVASVTYSLDGSVDTTYTTAVSVVGDGVHTLRYSAVDVAGNVESTKSVAVRIDGSPSVTADNAPIGWTSGPVLVTLASEDLLSGPGFIQYSIDGSDPRLPYTGPILVAAQGVTTLRYNSVDAVGNVEGTNVATVMIDDLAPSTTDNAPSDWVRGPVSLTLTATDSVSGVASTNYTVNSSTASIYSAPIVISAEGTNTVRFASSDVRGNVEGTRTASVRIDNTPPVVSNNAAQTYSASATVTFSSVDPLSGVATRELRIDGGPWAAATSITTSTPGPHSVSWRVMDTAGNVASGSADFEIIARTEESDSRVYYRGPWSPTNSTLRSGGAWTISQSTGAVAYVTFTGTHVELISTKAPTMGIAEITLDNSTTTLADYYAPATTHQTRVWSASGLANTRHSLRIAYTGTKNLLSGGTAIGLDAIDLAGKAELDLDAPVTSDNAPSEWRDGNAVVTLAPTDAQTWIVSTNYYVNGKLKSYSGPFSVTNEGTTTIDYYSVDGAGNREANKSALVRIDKTVPTVTDDAPTAWTRGPVTSHLLGSDSGSGIANIRYSTDGSEPSREYVDGVVLNNEGSSTIRYFATDNVGRQSSVNSVVVRVDNTSPLTVDDAPSGWTAGPVSVRLTSSDSLSGLVGVRYRVDGSTVATYTTPITVSASGIHTLEYSGVDVAGNTEPTRTAEITIDKTAPSSSATVRPSYTDTATIAISGSDTQSGLARTEWRLDDGPWTSGSSVTTDAPGPHTLSYRAVDRVGNVEEAHTAQFDVVTRVEQSDARLLFIGSWTTATSTYRSGGSWSYASTPGSAMYVSFNGTGLDLITTKAPTSGIARVTVDTSTPVLVDFYAPSNAHQSRAWSIAGLPNGAHMIKVEYTGSKNASSAGTAIGVDAFDITGPVTTALLQHEQDSPLLAYSGAWTTAASTYRSGGSWAYTANSGAAAYVAFTGNRIDLITTKAPTSGIARITVDGSGPQLVDLYSQTTVHKATVWSASGLSNGAHTVTVEYTGTKNDASGGTAIGIDAVKVAGLLTQAAVPGDPMYRFDDTDGRVAYSGNWTTASSSYRYGGSWKYTADNSGAVNVAFTGTRIDLITTKAPSSGIALVKLDSSEPVLVDLYAATNQHQAVAWSATGLSNTPHTVSIQYTGTRNPASTGLSIGIDAVDVAGALTQATPPVTETISRYEESDAHVSLRGSWTSMDSVYRSGGRWAYTSSVDASVSVSFTGTRVGWVTTKAPTSGIARVTVDGGTPVLVDVYSSTTVHQATVWTSPVLTSGPHTLVIEYTGTRNALSSGTAIGVDAFDVAGAAN